jgi:hypothetical protein
LRSIGINETLLFPPFFVFYRFFHFVSSYSFVFGWILGLASFLKGGGKCNLNKNVGGKTKLK